MSVRLAVLQFPGLNCEYETQRVAAYYGFDAKIVRWNDTSGMLADAHAYIIPGGFSYQDRVRAGAIAAKLPIMEQLVRADALGKPILGICNGCQILAEAGLYPNESQAGDIEVALAPNLRSQKLIGHVCDWVYVKIKHPQKSAFTTLYTEDEIIPVPISHGEGRFIFKNGLPNTHSHVVYTDASGHIDTQYPTNPNGTTANIAGLSNERGNVLGLMPHPERAAWINQVPLSLPHPWAKQKQDAFEKGEPFGEGPWAKLFKSMYISAQDLSQKLEG